MNKPHRPTLSTKYHKTGNTNARDRAGDRPDVGRLTIVVRPEKCTGCGSCEVACSIRRTGRPKTAESSIRIIHPPGGDTHVPLHCSYCEEAPCVRVCPGDALSRQNEFGLIAVDESKCSSCASCVLSCPFLVLHLGEPRPVADPCDLCGGSPECVRACERGALRLVEISNDEFEQRRQAARQLATALHETE